MLRIYLLSFLIFVACGDIESGAVPDAGPDEVDNLALTEAMFQRDRPLEIEIEIAESDWNQLRLQGRSFFDVVGSSCLTAPPEDPFTYFSARLKIDGDVIENVGVRKKGFFGSLDNVRPSLKIKFDEFVSGQRFSGLKRMTLNNNKSDDSNIKQCIGYDLFAAAGLPSPRCNFARVTINGADLGIFTHVESIKKQFLSRFFADNSGNLYEGALSDFRPGWVSTFQKKTNDDDPDRSDIEALVPALDVDDSQLRETLQTKVDLDGFNAFWAMEHLVMHADGYARNTNNFYIYHDPTSQKFHFIPWGIDSILVDHQTLPWEETQPPADGWAEGKLTRRLYNLPETRAEYFSELERQLADVFDESALLNEIDRLEAMLAPHLVRDLNLVAKATDSVRLFVTERRADLETALAGPDGNWSSDLRDPWCIEPIGAIEASFWAQWGTLGSETGLDEGSSTIDMDINASTLVLSDTGATAGVDDDGQAAIQLLGMLAPTEILLVHISMAAEYMTPGEVQLNLNEALGFAVTIDFANPLLPTFNTIGMIGDGTLTLSQAARTPGAPIVGTINSLVYESIF